MKILKKKTATRSWNGSYTETREGVAALKPLDLFAVASDSVMVAPAAHRPYVSRTAKAEGITYFTLGIPGTSEMLIVRIKPLKRKGQK